MQAPIFDDVSPDEFVFDTAEPISTVPPAPDGPLPEATHCCVDGEAAVGTKESCVFCKPNMVPADGMGYDLLHPNGTIDTMPPDSNVPTVDPLTLARTRLKQLRIVRRMLTYQKRAATNAIALEARTKRKRKNNKQAKASRKRNR
jgi:hypothetical protein